MPVKITTEPAKPEDLRFTISGITLRQRSRIYWALHEWHKNHDGDKLVTEDADLLQELWASVNED